jgi:hypothetical protein
MGAWRRWRSPRVRSTPPAWCWSLSAPSPKRPDRLRIDHLGGVAVPTLFVSGDRDAFGTPDELEAAHALVTGPVTAEWITGGRHELSRVADNADVAARVAAWLER